jgi:MscS family membrane protein
MVYCFTKTTVWDEWLEIKEKLVYKIKEIVETAGTAFAFPSQSIYVETVPNDQAEVFIPPSFQKSDGTVKASDSRRAKPEE